MTLPEVLAAARLTRLITADTVADPARDRLSALHPALDELLHCPWCAGFWAAAAVSLASRSRAGRAGVRVLALAQAGTMVLQASERLEGP